jgi:hypothetical protein
MATRRDALIAISAIAVPASAADGKFLTADELSRTAALIDVILPRTETPGASDAKVHLLIDERAAANPEFGARWRRALAALDGDPAATVERAYRAKAPEFQLLKDTTIDLYYSTREGLQTELGWNANTYLEEFRGCVD